MSDVKFGTYFYYFQDLSEPNSDEEPDLGASLGCSHDLGMSHDLEEEEINFNLIEVKFPEIR